MDDTKFREFLQRLAAQYELEPEQAEALLRRILSILPRRNPEDESP